MTAPSDIVHASPPYFGNVLSSFENGVQLDLVASKHMGLEAERIDIN